MRHKIISRLLDDMKNLLISLLLCILAMGAQAQRQPRLEHRDNSTARIVVNDRPMLMIGGELGNSSASTPEDVKRTFSHLHKMGLNTVLVPVSWELIEPQEGEFDMGTLDVILSEARHNELKVVLLWFGAWKNSMSCYAPEWFKRDVKRFPRAHTSEGVPVEEASSLSKNVLEADKRAFCHVMAYLRDHDALEQTVIMVQVENEIGMIEVPRDYSANATRLYQSAVPKQLTDYLKRHQKSLHPYLKEKLQPQAKVGANWAQLFGDDIYTEEIFQTWTYATYVEQIAKAGREIYNLPMYVNVALNSRDRKPGQYPSGGPLAHLIDLWHCGAPSIDVLGVDIYLNLCIGLFLGTIETGWEHLAVIQYHDIAIVEIVDDMAEGQETVGVVAFFVLLEHVDGLTLAVQHHQSTFITTINFLYRTVFVVEHAVGWLHGHLTLR